MPSAPPSPDYYRPTPPYPQPPRQPFAADAHQAPPPPHYDQGFDQGEEISDQSAAFALRNRRHEGPRQGIRAALHRIGVPVRKSPREQDFDLDIDAINKPLRYAKVIGIANFKGGVGKTTLGMAVASTIAQHRRKGEVVIIDTDHKGSLTRRTPGTQTQDLQQLVADPNIADINDVKSYMLSNAHRLSVLGSSMSPQARALHPQEYLRALQILRANHLFVFVDMDTSAASPAYRTIVESLDAMIIPVATALDSAEASRDVMDWLRANDLDDLARRVVILLNYISKGDPHLDTDSIKLHYRSSEGRPVIEIPWDEHLAEAGPINLDLLNKDTRRMFVKAAAEVVKVLPST